jgi:ubiquinone/menaquinone biosynthesis C-methylase UbiE
MTVEQWYGELSDEDPRLGGFSLEWERTKVLIGRVLPPPPAVVADIAGGTGRYAAWLATAGYEVSLLDLVPRHVERARQRASAEGLRIDCVLGDARALPWADQAFDVVLVMGALYHLPERGDRLACLAQAHRVLRPGGALVTAQICRWASLFDGYRQGFVADPAFRAILDQDLATGRHDNPALVPHYFTTAYFHTPDEVGQELADAGFQDIQVLPVEGFTSLTGVPEALQTAQGLPVVLADIRATEAVSELLAASSHLLGLARKP